VRFTIQQRALQGVGKQTFDVPVGTIPRTVNKLTTGVFLTIEVPADSIDGTVTPFTVHRIEQSDNEHEFHDDNEVVYAGSVSHWAENLAARSNGQDALQCTHVTLYYVTFPKPFVVTHRPRTRAMPRPRIVK
jgi:hypothetical protein